MVVCCDGVGEGDGLLVFLVKIEVKFSEMRDRLSNN